MKHKVTFGVGQGFDANGKPLADPGTRTTALAFIASRFGGFSAHDTTGGWINGKGELVLENSLIIEVYTDSLELVEDTAQWLAAKLNQEAVMVVTQAVSDIKFVGQLVTA